MKAISSMATRHVLADLVAAAQAAGYGPVEVESVGGVAAAARVAEGEGFDIVVLASDAVDRLAADGFLDAASVRPLVVSQVAVAVASGVPGPAVQVEGTAFPDAEALGSALAGSARIGYSTGPSGTALLRMIDAWGLADSLRDRLVQARPGVPVAQLISDGAVDLGFQQLSELVGQPGVRILGVLPADCRIDTTFSGAVATSAADPQGAAEIVAFFAADEVASLKSANCFVAP